MAEANEFLRKQWIPYHNKTFTVAAQQGGSAFVPYGSADLKRIFSHQEERIVGNDNTVTFGNLSLQVQPQTFRFSLAKCRVQVCRYLDDTIGLYYGHHLLGQYSPQGEALVPTTQRSRKKKAA